MNIIANKFSCVLLLFFCSLFLINNNVNAQFSFTTDANTATYSKLENTSEYFGIASGKIDLNAFFNATNMDTSIWRMVTNSDNGKYSLIQNKISYNGIDSGLIKIPLIFLVNAFSFDTIRFYDSLNNSFEHAVESSQNMSLDIVEWIDNRSFAILDSTNIFVNLNSFYGTTNIFGNSNVARKDTLQNISENWTFAKNTSVNGILSVDTIDTPSGNTVFKNSTGSYIFKSTNSSHSWRLNPTESNEFLITYVGNNNGLRISSSNTIYPNANNDGDVGIPSQRYRTAYLGTSLDIIGTTNKIKSYYDASNGLEISANSTGGMLINNIKTGNSDIYLQTNGSSKWAFTTNSGVNYFRPTVSGVRLGQPTASDRWDKSYFANDMDITWTTNVDAGFLRGVSDIDMTGIYLRSPNGTKYYITVDDSGIINATTSPF